MSTVSFGRERKGRYASFSITMPMTPQISIVSTVTMITVQTGRLHPQSEDPFLQWVADGFHQRV